MKTKRFWMPAIAALFMMAFVGGCKDEKVGVVGVCPLVVSTDPTNGATNIPLEKIIKVTFNEPMDPASITPSAISLQGVPSGGRGFVDISGTVAYDGPTNTMSFTPSARLVAKTTYTGTIATTVKDKMGNALQVAYVWSFNTGITVSPTVSITDPANNATGVVLNKILTATFSVPMDPLTITTSTFTVKQGATSVAGTVAYSGSSALFKPTVALSANTLYTATITTGAKNNSNISLASDYVWKFTTGSVVAPSVTTTDPANLATGVPLNKVTSATFSEVMDPATITASTFTVRTGNSLIAGTISYSGTTAMFTPTSNLLAGTQYTATLTTGAKNLAGVALANDYVWSFTAGTITAPLVTSTDPANAATNVPLNKVISVNFNQAMDPSTITGTTFTLKNGATSITGTVAYSGVMASFTPTASLVSGTTYTATITTGAKNVAGIPLANNYVWTFSAGAIVAPTVTLTDPVNLGTNVSLNKVISATFSQAMDPLSITSTSFTLKAGTSPVAGAINYSGTTATFTPTVFLVPGTTYTATITIGARNVAGTPLNSDFVWTFATGTATAPTVISTDPTDLVTGVSLDKVISASFSQVMDPLTITSSTFNLKIGASSVLGTVNYAGTTATFTPTSNLLSGTIYTATITTGAKNAGGVALVNNYVWTFSTKAPLGPQGVDLKSVARFGIIAGVGVSNNAGFSEIRNLDVGISPGVRSSITGFPPAIIVNGAMYASDDTAPPGVPAMLTQAKQDLVDVYLYVEGATSPAPATVSGDQGGKTLAPGIYKSTSTLLIQSGDLTLDAQGDANAVWIFQVASAFTTVGGAGGSIILSGGAQAKNVYWQTGSSATIGDNTAFKGNILALTSITMNSGAKAVGRMLARNGSVVMTNANIIDKP